MKQRDAFEVRHHERMVAERADCFDLPGGGTGFPDGVDTTRAAGQCGALRPALVYRSRSRAYNATTPYLGSRAGSAFAADGTEDINFKQCTSVGNSTIDACIQSMAVIAVYRPCLTL